MNREEKAAVVQEVAAQIKESEAVFAVDYRGISVPQAADLRRRLGEAGARFRVVKNTLTERAAEQSGAEELKQLLEGPTALMFVPADGDVALAAKALASFRREHARLEFKGGRMSGEPLTIEQIDSLSRLPGRDVLTGQLTGALAAPLTSLVRGLGQLVGGLAIQLQQIVEKDLIGGGAPATEPEESELPMGAAEMEPERSDGAEGG
jgi:large subunit ribosomal protein L10